LELDERLSIKACFKIVVPMTGVFVQELDSTEGFSFNLVSWIPERYWNQEQEDDLSILLQVGQDPWICAPPHAVSVSTFKASGRVLYRRLSLRLNLREVIETRSSQEDSEPFDSWTGYLALVSETTR
jgi:hypothetical protein